MTTALPLPPLALIGSSRVAPATSRLPSDLSSVVLAIVAYEAETTITSVLDRIPIEIAESVGAILVSDDGSVDHTTARAMAWAEAHPRVPVVIQRLPVNRGYGGNQKACYRWAIEHRFDVVVMIHGDGQYAPELVGEMIRPLLTVGCCRGTEIQAVFGSRMLTRGGARRGGMPAYKWLGNRVLTGFQNAVTGLRLSEWHSGYRAYRTRFLAQLPFDRMSDGFDFDTEIILAARTCGARISEIPIPTYYGDELCRVNGLRYAADVVVDVVRYRASGETIPFRRRTAA